MLVCCWESERTGGAWRLPEQHAGCLHDASRCIGEPQGLLLRPQTALWDNWINRTRVISPYLVFMWHIEIAEWSLRGHKERKSRILKNCRAKFVICAFHLKTQLIVSCDSSDNQIYFGCDWKHISRLTQYVSKYVGCQGRSTALIMRWKLNFKQEISRNILYIQVRLLRNCHQHANMPRIVMEGHIRQKCHTKTWLIHLILLI